MCFDLGPKITWRLLAPLAQHNFTKALPLKRWGYGPGEKLAGFIGLGPDIAKPFAGWTNVNTEPQRRIAL